MWLLIVYIPDLCTLSYLKSPLLKNVSVTKFIRSSNDVEFCFTIKLNCWMKKPAHDDIIETKEVTLEDIYGS